MEFWVKLEEFKTQWRCLINPKTGIRNIYILEFAEEDSRYRPNRFRQNTHMHKMFKIPNYPRSIPISKSISNKKPLLALAS